MTHRKPQRNARGQFVRKQPPARCPSGTKRPDARPAPPAASTVKKGHLAVRVCEECSTELDEVRVRIRGHVLYVQHCPRCTPDPMEVLS